MTETDWNACTDPQPLLEFLRGKVSDRKLRLFAVACCWRVWKRMPEEEIDGLRFAIVTAEQYADGLASLEELTRARQRADQAASNLWEEAGAWAVLCTTYDMREAVRLAGGMPACHAAAAWAGAV